MNDKFPDLELSYVALERLMTTLQRARSGDFSARMASSGEGIEQECADAINDLLGMNARLSDELRRVAEAVTQGDLKVRARPEKAGGAWLEQLRAIDRIVTVFDRHTTELRSVTKAMTAGDFSRTLPVGPEAVHRGGDLSQAAEDLNALCTHARGVLAEVTRVITVAGHQGRFDSRTSLPTTTGAWAMLVDAADGLTAALFEQVQDLNATAQAIGAGNLLARVSATCTGELQVLKLGLNRAFETVAGLCGDLRRVAQEVTVEGKLAVGLRQPDLHGEWQSAQLACNRTLGMLGSTLRTLFEGLESVLAGHHSLPLDPSAPGEFGAAQRSLGKLAEQERRTQQGIDTLLHGRFHELEARGSERDLQLFLLGTRLKQEWLRAARIGLVEARERCWTEREFAAQALTCITQTADAAAGAYYMMQGDEYLVQAANFGCEQQSGQIRKGEGLVGRAAMERKVVFLDKLEQHGVKVRGGALELTPRSVAMIPIKDEERVYGVLELCFVSDAGPTALELLESLNADLCAAAAKYDVKADSERDPIRARVRQLEEDLLIANARLERMNARPAPAR